MDDQNSKIEIKVCDWQSREEAGNVFDYISSVGFAL